jgi:hypothetical protein
MHPRVRMRLTHPQERSVPLLNGRLFHVGQNEEPFVRDRGQRTGAICRVTATRARWPIHRAGIHRGPQSLLKMGQQGLKFGVRESGQ